MKIQNLQHEHLSRLKQSYSRCAREIKKVSNALLTSSPLMPASAYELRRKCGKQKCVCVTKGKLHPIWVVTWKENGKNHLKSIPKDKLNKFKSVTKRYQNFRKLRDRWISIQGEMLLIIDKIEERRTIRPKDGYHQL